MNWSSVMAPSPSNASTVFYFESSSSTPDSFPPLSGADDATIKDDADLDGTSVPPIPCSNDWFFFIIYGPLYAITCGFGLVGNCLSFCVLHRYSRNENVSTFLLKALAVSDNIFLSVAAFVQMYPAMAIFLGATDSLKAIYPKYQMLAWPIAHMVQLGTVWVMVLVASTRYVAVCHPLHAQRLCTKKNVQVQIALIAIFSVVYNIPRFVEYRYVEINVTDIRDNTTHLQELNLGLASHPVYNIVYENIAYCLFAFLLPLAILIFFNVHLLRELKRSQRLRKTMRKGKTTSDENNVTLVMVVIIISFILCQTPASANQVLFYVIDDTSRNTCSAYMMYYHLSNLLITISSALNFIIYCLFRRQFQKQLRVMVGCQTPPKRGALRGSDTSHERRGGRAQSDLTHLTSSSVARHNAAMSVSTSVDECQAQCQAQVVKLMPDND